MHGTQAAKTIGELAIGDIVGYIEKKQERQRELLSLRKWHIVQVKPQQESSVCDDLEDLGMAAYCPREPRSMRVHICRHRTVWRPMFPGYLFAGFDPDGKLWDDIRYIDGAVRLFMINFRPVPVGGREMDRIRECEAERALGRGFKLPPLPLKPDTVVRITDGPFMGFFGVVLSVNQKSRRVNVEIDIFGRKTPTEFNGDQLETV